MLVAVASVAGVVLLGAGAARAHVGISPRVLEAGAETELLVELPQLRPGPPPTGLEVAGRGVRQLSAEPAGRAGVETRWRARVRVEVDPGPLQLVLTARFAGGETVDVRQTVTVVPARGNDGVPVAAVAGAAVLAVAGTAVAALALRRARRRG